ncbi:MAG: hypothetical protein M3Q42_09015 [Pseudomonadota bacterium]|nr:hypothetical protein [Pseudomonadota bacterium]
MMTSAFRFTSGPFNARLRAAMGARKPRNGVLRAFLGVIGLGLLVVLVVLGVVVGAAMLAAGVVYKLVQGRGSLQRRRDERVVEAEYRVVSKPLLPR